MTLNPVLSRELLQRMRRGRAVVTLTAFLALCALVAGTTVVTLSSETFGSFSDGAFVISDSKVLLPSRFGLIGRSVYGAVSITVVILVSLVVCLSAAATITGDSERKTLLGLNVSPLGARRIALGKLLASVAYGLLLVVASLPLMATGFAYGGLRASDVAGFLLGAVWLCFFLAAVGLAVSSTFKRTITAVAGTFVVVGSLVMGSFMTAGFVAATQQGDPTWPLLVNPYVTLTDLAGDSAVGSNKKTVWDHGTSISNEGEEAFLEVGGPGPLAERAGGGRGITVPLWVQGFVVQLLIVALSFWWATQRLRTPAFSDR